MGDPCRRIGISLDKCSSVKVLLSKRMERVREISPNE